MATSNGNNSGIFKDDWKMIAPKWGLSGLGNLTASSKFASDRPSLFKFVQWASKVRFGCSRSFKVDDFDTNRKRVGLYNFLLVRHCEYGPIFHRFWDTATYWLKIAYFSYPSLIRRPCSLCSLRNFALKLTMRKQRVMGLSKVKAPPSPTIIAWVVLTQCQGVTDRQTDGSLYTKGRYHYFPPRGVQRV